MSSSGSTTCPNCRSVRDSSEQFCGQCGYRLKGSGGNYSTLSPDGLQRSRTTRILDAQQPKYTPLPPTQPAYPLQPSSRSLRNKLYLTIIAVLLIMLIGTVGFL